MGSPPRPVTFAFLRYHHHRGRRRYCQVRLSDRCGGLIRPNGRALVVLSMMMETNSSPQLPSSPFQKRFGQQFADEKRKDRQTKQTEHHRLQEKEKKKNPPPRARMMLVSIDSLWGGRGGLGLSDSYDSYSYSYSYFQISKFRRFVHMVLLFLVPGNSRYCH